MAARLKTLLVAPRASKTNTPGVTMTPGVSLSERMLSVQQPLGQIAFVEP
jgi:hypothetical protein